ncbi:hypothetical protein [Fibrella aquatilis]|uniref:Uncharacterized protein n=1 Tax=Fibrella aquatilis TaxID=2817059 RepID=A0A939JZD3_9BACT|nr:hypothetical protein [Fibrella aquatilis]MBO0933024.1 hypothetical protein [Fibrella aquatilis]
MTRQFAIAGLLLLIGCTRQNNDTPITPQLVLPSCIMAAFDLTTTIQGQGAIKDTYLNTFDANGLLTTATVQYNTQGPGGSYDSREAITYQYDSGGFLQESVEKSTTTGTYSGGAPTTSAYLTTNRFTYEAGRLSLVVRRTTGAYRSMNTQTYQYDGAGRLSQYTSTDSASKAVTSYTYMAGVISRVTQNGKDQYTINGGRLTASAGGYHYDYDTQGRLAGIRGTTSGSTSTEYEYEPTGKPILMTQPQLRFKGIPFDALLQVLGGAEQYGLLRRETEYRDVNGKCETISESVHTYQLNANGYPTGQTTTRTSSSPTSPGTEKTTATYAYRGC